MFAFKVGTIIEEFKKHIPELSKIFDKPFKEVVKTFHKLPNISIDYAVMEKTDRGVLLPVDIFWSDIGSWESLYDVFEKDKKGNALSGEVITIDTKGSFIFGNKRLIATIGIEDVIVIETEDALLISKKGETQKVKELVKILSEKGYPQVKEHVTSYRPWGSFTLLEKGMRYKIKKIGIFGSYVKGTNKKNSDLDILVEFTEIPTLLIFINLERYLSDKLQIKVDLVTKQALKPVMGKQILKEVIFI